MAHGPVFQLVTLCAVLLPGRVVAPKNGIFASSVRFPFLAGLIDETVPINYIPFCTGTIVTASFVLTTYGCLKRTDYGYNRKDVLTNPLAIVVIYGTSYSPTFTKQSDRLYPNWELDPAIGQKDPSERTEKSRYDARRARQFFFPDAKDISEAYENDDQRDDIVKAGNEYIAYTETGQKYSRYRIDFALIELQIPVKWDDHTVPAIFPLQGAALSRNWWEKRVFDEKYGVEFMDSCYLIGWGGWNGDPGTQVRLRYAEVKYVPYDDCELSYCSECAVCNKTIRVRYEHQACYKTVFNSDGCLADEGAPVWCPWAGVTITRKGRPYQTGAVLGLLSQQAGCLNGNVPSVYSNTWQAYGFISRTVNYTFPPNVLVYEDVLETPDASPENEQNAE